MNKLKHILKSIKFRIKRRTLIYALLCLLIISGLVAAANYYVVNKSSPYLFSEVADVPAVQTGLLLGTSKYLKNGTINLYFKYRIDAAFKLYEAGKIKCFIISGDNSQADYNEPLDMKNDLIQKGVPDSVIYLDYAGFRTFDSVIRANKIFGQSKLISISQQFHNQRAVFIARSNNIEAYGYNATDVNTAMGFKTKVREVFARVKVFIDMLINRQPKFLGEKIKIG